MVSGDFYLIPNFYCSRADTPNAVICIDDTKKSKEMDEMASEGAREAKTKTDPVASVFELPALALGASDFATKKMSVVEGGDGEGRPAKGMEKAAEGIDTSHQKGDVGSNGNSSIKVEEAADSTGKVSTPIDTSVDAEIAINAEIGMATDDEQPAKETEINGVGADKGSATENDALDTDREDVKVTRAKALAEFVEKFGSVLTPEQIAKITPEQIDRISRSVASSFRSAAQSGQPRIHRAPLHTRPKRPRSRPIVELREYELSPIYANSYLQLTALSSALRKSLLPLRLFAVPETGGTLNIATHLYHWTDGYAERNAGDAKCRASEEWKDYIKKVQPALVRQQSTIFMECPIVGSLDGVVGLEMGRAERAFQMGGRHSKDAVYEIYRYQLKLGFDVIPKFLELYEKGLPSKLAAKGTDPSTSLLTLLYSTVGMLNEIVEIWRHGGGFDAMERAGSAAHLAKEWRQSGQKISELTVGVTRTILRPLSFSPLR